MGKLFVTSDLHADAVTVGLNRYQDCETALREVADATLAEAKRANLVGFLFLGDLSDPDNVRSHRASALAVREATRMRSANVPSFWLTGNHDVIEDGSRTSTLSPLKEVGHPVSVFDEPTHGVLFGATVFVVVLPFVARTHSYDAEAAVMHAAKEYREKHDGLPVMVWSHLSCSAVQQFGSESGSMARGREHELPLAAIAELLPGATVLQGHYHKRQSFEWGEGVTVHVPGSPERLRFDEEDNDTGYLVVEW